MKRLKKVAKKKVAKKVAKKKVAKQIVKRAPKPANHDLTPDPMHLIMNRMLDVVEANTLQVKASIVLMTDIQKASAFQLTLLIESQLHNVELSKPKTKRTKQTKAESTPPAETKESEPEAVPEPEQKPEVPADSPEEPSAMETELSPESELNIATLMKGFEQMKQVIGISKANEYLKTHDGCKNIEALHKDYWTIFVELAPDFCKSVLTEQKSTGIKPPAEIKITVPDLRAALSKVDKAKGRDEAIKILHYYFPQEAENKTVNSLKESDYTHLIESCDKSLAA